MTTQKEKVISLVDKLYILWDIANTWGLVSTIYRHESQ
jgi:hypothetical protein